ncbi:hypothetical protein [Cryptosporangium phraense]|uniref:Cyclase n=1 Tax=Cryptosporangium phraense TaxID=2593070 RepID=A0A545ATX0_9ACTN|nr:hypothetical protein [Cryptosporangium phraense]TQS44778.1 hypothetical protein FL583_12505 [Cryptosporangium phraense]
MSHPLRRITAAAVLVLAAGSTFVLAPPAYADTVTVNYSCEVPLTGTLTGDVDVTITAPATAAVGDTVEVTVQTGPAPFTAPIDLEAGSVTPSIEVTVGGAQTGSFTAQGTPNTEPIPANTPITPAPMTGSLTLTGAGQVDLSPGTITATAVTVFGTFAIPCTPTSTPPVAASIAVS